MNETFFNPHFGFPCDMCDFNAKTKAGLQVHMNAKHKNRNKTSPKLTNPLKKKVDEEANIESESQQTVKCDMCDFDAENEQDLDTHISENHNNEKDIEIS